ncbi:MAG: ADP-ribosylglycohydrolase family protein [Phycisphaerae bacterium]
MAKSLATLRLLLSGLAAGDSLGSTSEFVDPRDIPRLYGRYKDRGWPFAQVGGGSFGWQAGEPTDDTQMALCLVDSYRQLRAFDGQDVARRFVHWMRGGPRDIGATTGRTLMRIAGGVSWQNGGLEAFLHNPELAANGSLMRNGVVPGMAVDLADALRITLSHGMMTHYGPLAQICCAAQTWLIWRLLEDSTQRTQRTQRMERDDPKSSATSAPSALSVLAPGWPGLFRQEFTVWLDSTADEPCARWRANVAEHLGAAWRAFESAQWDPRTFNPFATDFAGRTGYCLLTLQIAVWALYWSLVDEPLARFLGGTPQGLPRELFERRGPYVLGLVALIGHDADTYGATAGPLIAAAHGCLPAELINGLWALRENW